MPFFICTHCQQRLSAIADASLVSSAPCALCLDFLPQLLSPSRLAAIRQQIDPLLAQSNSVSINLSPPGSVTLRDWGARLFLANQPFIPSPRVVDIREAARALLSDALHIVNDGNSPVRLLIEAEHAQCISDTQSLIKEDGNPLVEKHNRKRRRTFHQPKVVSNPTPHGHSIAAVTRCLALLDSESFAHGPGKGFVPPQTPQEPCHITVSVEHAPIWIGGRYTKYGRDISQTPWAPDDAKALGPSVEMAIAPALIALTESKESKFQASGREDINVRMLGDGRPFVLQMISPKRPHISPDSLATTQAAINDGATPVFVSRLQQIAPDQVALMQEDKKKSYRCVVWVKKRVEETAVLALNGMHDVVLAQATPLRVMHRRSLSVRSRTVYSIHAEFMSAHFLLVDLVTQAGTYVKEFVSGDRGRTVPSLGLLLGCEEALCVQLDVNKVDLPFPPV